MTAIGMIIGALPHLAVGRPAKISGMAIRLLCVACVAFVFRPLAGNSAVAAHWGLAFSLMTALAVLALLLEAVLTALLRVDEQRARFRVALVDEMRVELPLGAAVGRVGFAHRVRGRGHGAGRAGRVHRPAAGDPGRVPALRRDPGHLPADGPGAGQGDRDRRVRGAGPLRAGQPAGHRRGAGTRHSRAAAARARIRRAHARHRAAVAGRPDTRRCHGAGLAPGPAAHRRAGRRGDPAGPGPRLGGRDRPQAERALPRRRGGARGLPGRRAPGGRTASRPGRR